jgi:hypothetical protein
LYRFVFQNGEFKEQQIVATIPKDKAHFHVEGNRVYENRYVVSPAGEVFDLQTKTLYAEKSGLLVGIEDGSVIIKQLLPPGFGQTKTYLFNLTTKKYTGFEEPNFFTLGNESVSPDRKRKLILNNSGERLVIVTRNDRDPTKLSTERIDGDYKIYGKSRILAHVPSIWLDNDRILIQRAKGDLVLFDLKTRKSTHVLKIPIHGKDPVDPRSYFFYFDKRSLYYRADKLYEIDLDNWTFKETIKVNDYPLGNDFHMRIQGDNRAFLHHGQEIGTFIAGSIDTTDGYLATSFFEGPLDTTFPKGVRVWSNDTRKWITLRIKFRPNLLGWMN